MHRQYRFILFPLSILAAIFKPSVLAKTIKKGCQGGYRLIRRELTLEPKRVLLFFKSIAFGMVFQRDENEPDQEYNWKIVSYKTRMMSKTVNPAEMERVLAEGAYGGYELYHAMKYPARFLFIFPREAYFFIFRKPEVVQPVVPSFEYTVNQTPYRFFSRTIDESTFTQELNTFGSNASLVNTFRDERRVFGAFAQPTVVAIWEHSAQTNLPDQLSMS
jgi:hypothetical protein